MRIEVVVFIRCCACFLFRPCLGSGQKLSRHHLDSCQAWAWVLMVVQQKNDNEFDGFVIIKDAIVLASCNLLMARGRWIST